MAHSFLLLTPTFYVASGLLAISGFVKIRDPGPFRRTMNAVRLPIPDPVVRLLGLFELLVGGSCLLAPRLPNITILAILYAGFGSFLAFVLAKNLPIPSCGCAGSQETPPSWIHVTLNYLAALSAVPLTRGGVPGLPSLLLHAGAAGIPVLLGLSSLGYLAYLTASFVPPLFSSYQGRGRTGENPHRNTPLLPTK